MDAIAEPLDRVTEAARWFAAATELRLLHVTTTEDLRIAALERIAKAEQTPTNTRPFVFLESPVEENDDGWSSRMEELREEMTALAERAADGAPFTVAPLPALPAPTSRGVVPFAVALRSALDAVSAPAGGLVVVLAPLWNARPQTWVEELGALLARPELARARWILVETDPAPTRALAEKLGPAAETVDGRFDAAAAKAALAAMLASMKSAPAGAGSHRLAGMAGPREAPPPRVRSPEPAASAAATAAQLTAAGLPPALGDPTLMHKLRIAVLEAANAFGEGRAGEAIARQREARDLCASGGLAREAVIMELILGSYTTQAGSPEQAVRVFSEAAAHAEAGRFGDLHTQALMAKGGALMVMRRPHEAALAYADAGQIGAANDAPILAIEAFRMAGHALDDAGASDKAATAWRRALEIAEKVPADTRKGSTAPQTARDLAAACRRHGLLPQADALEARAAQWEAEAAAPPEKPAASPAEPAPAPVTQAS